MSAALRARVARGLNKVVADGRSLNDVLPDFDHLESKDRALARELISGTLREYFRLVTISQLLLKKALKKKDSDINCLILVGLYQIYSTRIPDHAILSETVQATVKIRKQWAKGLVNALLREALRNKEQLLKSIQKDPANASSTPQWLYQMIQNDWPEELESIIQSSHQRAPLTLRVNRRQQSRDEYQKVLQTKGIVSHIHPLASDALLLEKSCNVQTLPGFKAGDFTVQDSAAQLVSVLLGAKPSHKILDACAAPGGKTSHILELTDNQAELIALDQSETRLKRLEDNLARLKLNATTLVADAIETSQWSEGLTFDRILCDAPCSATGIIRRHPDIMVLRRESDIEQLVEIQREMMDALWLLLKPGGMMIYSTCSILKSENTHQVRKFLERTEDATLDKTLPFESDYVIDKNNQMGWQILPGEQQMDGFFIAKLVKDGA